jgi:hypothetical protein
MNSTIEKFTRQSIKDALAKCNGEQVHLFKRMYAHKDLSTPINDVVDKMPIEKLDWALTQCETTIKKNAEKK